ncbi:APC family permease [Ammoniphilus sp. YIM 78166]|uniref:APC family permease n=1 Tax=Ammoniphilus sp. YIM 78166 TaxID=1644106 RepID=UPI00107039E9|nr:APC family permease [Ammoniphilus sp. YIM 78166]
MPDQQAHHFQRSLTLLPLVILGLAYMAPMTVFSTYGVVTQVSHGLIPSAYLVALVAMLFTAYSYGRMVKVFPFSGSAYTYTQKTMSSRLGFLVGWAVLMDYLFLPMINVLLCGIFLSAAFPSIPAWIWMVSFVAMMTGINIVGIRMTSMVNGVLVAFQFLVTILFVILAMKGIAKGMGMGTFISALPFYNPEVSFSFIMAGASILCLSFLGFDAVTTLSEETVTPKKTVPRAIFLVALIGGFQFIFVSYIAQLVYPDFNSFRVIDSAAFEIAEFIGGPVFASIFLAGMITSTIASGMSSHASASRLLFAMGRESVLPSKLFGYVHPRYKTPSRNILLIGLFSLSALVFDLATAASFINFGALVAFTFVNLSVISHYYVRNKERSGKDFLLNLLMPATGAGFTLWLWSNLDSKSILLGLFWVSVGFGYLLYLTRFFSKRPPEFHFEEDLKEDFQVSTNPEQRSLQP